MCHILLKDSVYRRRCKEYDIRTEIVSSGFAEFAVSTGLARLKRHAVADLQMCDIFSNLYYSATRLMSEYKRRLYDIVSDRTGLIIMQIASADSHIFQLYKHLIVLWLRDVTLLKSHLADSKHYRYLHLSFHRFPP